MEISILKKIGLSDKEIKVYCTLLEYGAISVRGLAEVSGINRGTAYDILKSLQEQGLVSYYHDETKQKFVAEEPDKLMDVLRAREAELKRAKEDISGLIPELKLLGDRGDKHPTSKLYEGFKGIRYILDDLLMTMEESDAKEYYVYSATELSDDINKAYPDFTKARIRKKIHVRAISLAEGGKTHGLDERRWLGTHDKSATFIIIYDNKCAFISRDAKGQPVGVIIENRNIYETQRVIFLRLWETLIN